MMIPLSLWAIVAVFIGTMTFILGLWYGHRLGKMCSCCGFEMDCRICVQYRCKNALKHGK